MELRKDTWNSYVFSQDHTETNAALEHKYLNKSQVVVCIEGFVSNTQILVCFRLLIK